MGLTSEEPDTYLPASVLPRYRDQLQRTKDRSGGLPQLQELRSSVADSSSYIDKTVSNLLRSCTAGDGKCHSPCPEGGECRWSQSSS